VRLTLRLFKRHRTNMLHVILFLIAAAWLGFQTFAPTGPQVAFFNIALPAALGVWLNDLAYKQRRSEEVTERRVGKTEERVDELEKSDIGGRVVSLEETARAHHGMPEVIEVQEREIVANRAALQLMREAVVLKEATGIPVLAETFIAMNELEKQINVLSKDIEKNRAQLKSNADSWTEEKRNA
jgi:uncharacterized small protein (DUF1192 family)